MRSGRTECYFTQPRGCARADQPKRGQGTTIETCRAATSDGRISATVAILDYPASDRAILKGILREPTHGLRGAGARDEDLSLFLSLSLSLSLSDPSLLGANHAGAV